MNAHLQREVRILKIYSFVLSAAMIVIGCAAFQTAPQRQRFSEIDVERLNLVEPDGKLDMVISDVAHFPDPVVSGKKFKRQGVPNPGMLFYNQQGDEDGGLTFYGSKTEQGSRAGGDLLFDQFNQDQVVGIMYGEANGKRSAAFHVWERPDTPIAEIMPKFEAAQKLPAGERQAATNALREAGLLGAQRVYLGRNPDREATLLLADGKGHTRIRVAVDAAGNPLLEFLDESGKVTYRLPPKPGQPN